MSSGPFGGLLRRRRNHGSAAAEPGHDDDAKQHFKPRKPQPGLRDLSSTLARAVSQAVRPSEPVRSREYTRFLTSRVAGLTLGWHIFRAVVESMFLIQHGLAYNTVVVQMFVALSIGSVLLHTVNKTSWLDWRELICLGTNYTYGVITVLKIFHLVPRLPNENNYMFKHCFLTTADAVFSQVPAHKQVLLQFAEAVVRTIVWHKYNVLPDVPLLGVIAISLAWQVWLLVFASMLQARHITAFLSARPPPQQQRQASTAGPAAAGTSSLDSPARVLPLLPGPAAAGAVAAAPQAVEAAPEPAAQQASSQALPVAITSPNISVSGSRPVGHAGGAAAHGEEPIPVAAADGQAAALGVTSPLARQLPHNLASPDLRHMSGDAAAKRRMLRALKGLVNSPSSYVLLAKQRAQAGPSTSTSAQLYITAADPEQLPTNWHERIGRVVQESAPGWHVVSACARKGSLVVHLDLAYVPPHQHPAAAAKALGPAGAPQHPLPGALRASCEVVAAAEDDQADWPAAARFSTISATSGACAAVQPSGAACGATSGSPLSSVQVLDHFLAGLGPQGILESVGLPLSLPNSLSETISLQHSDRLLLEYQTSRSACSARSSAAGTATTAERLPAAATAAAMRPAPPRAAWARRLPAPLAVVAESVCCALRPPPCLSTPEYAAFLSARCGGLHLAYCWLMLLSTALFYLRRRQLGASLLTAMTFMTAELLSVGAYLALAQRPGRWAALRCRLVYCGALLRALHQVVTTAGLLPRIIPTAHCSPERWMVKILVVSALQAMCMQTPVHLGFLFRLPCLVMNALYHRNVCGPRAPALVGSALQVAWEMALFAAAAVMQSRHLAAFERLAQRQAQGQAPSLASAKSSNSLSTLACHEDLTLTTATATTTACREPSNNISQAEPNSNNGGAGTSSVQRARASAPGHLAGPPAPAADVPQPEEVVAEADADAPAPWRMVALSCMECDDPQDVSLSAMVAVLGGRWGGLSAPLELRFTCLPHVVDELQVVVRHVGPSAAYLGLHTAQPARDIVRALTTPAGALALAAASPGQHAQLAAALSLAAVPADLPGVAHVELWRARRRLCSCPVMLAAAEPAAAGAAAGGAAAGCGASQGTAAGGACGAPQEGCSPMPGWVRDVQAYADALALSGHRCVGAQYVEEVGCWMAALAGLARGTPQDTTAAGQRVAHMLYFYDTQTAGSTFMLLEPGSRSKAQGAGAGGAAAGQGPKHAGGAAPAAGAASGGHLVCALRQMLLCSGRMLLAVAVEAGCADLASHLSGLLRAQLGAGMAEVVAGAVTPVTQLPLLHAAAKSGSAEMVDLVAGWLKAAGGGAGMWEQEACVAMALAAGGGSQSGDWDFTTSNNASNNNNTAAAMQQQLMERGGAPPAASTVLLPCAAATHSRTRSGASYVEDSAMAGLSQGQGAWEARGAAVGASVLLCARHEQGAAGCAGLACQRHEQGGVCEPLAECEEEEDPLTATLMGSFKMEQPRSRAASGANLALALPLVAPVVPSSGPSSGTTTSSGARSGAPPAGPAGDAELAAGKAPTRLFDFVAASKLPVDSSAMPRTGPPPPQPPPQPAGKVVPHAPGDGGAAQGSKGDGDGEDTIGTAMAAAISPSQVKGGEQHQPRSRTTTAKVLIIRPSAKGSSALSQLSRVDAMGSGAQLAGVGTATAAAGAEAAGQPPLVRHARQLHGAAGGSSDTDTAGYAPDGASATAADDGFMVITPLHVALALGDGGALATHILQAYPDAYALWQAQQQQGEAAASSAAGVTPMRRQSSSPSPMASGGHPFCLVPSGVAPALRRAAAATGSSRPSYDLPQEPPCHPFASQQQQQQHAPRHQPAALGAGGSQAAAAAAAALQAAPQQLEGGEGLGLGLGLGDEHGSVTSDDGGVLALLADIKAQEEAEQQRQEQQQQRAEAAEAAAAAACGLRVVRATPGGSARPQGPARGDSCGEEEVEAMLAAAASRDRGNNAASAGELPATAPASQVSTSASGRGSSQCSVLEVAFMEGLRWVDGGGEEGGESVGLQQQFRPAALGGGGAAAPRRAGRFLRVTHAVA